MPTKRKRERSKTPEVPWELLLADNSPAPDMATSVRAPGDGSGRGSTGANGTSRRDGVGSPDARPAAAPVASAVASRAATPAPAPALRGEEALQLERDAWRRLVSQLVALRGDPEVDTLLKERHPELLPVVESICAPGKPSTTLDKAREVARGWFERGLKGSNRHGAAEKAGLCSQLRRAAEARAQKLLSGGIGRDPSRLARLLELGRAEEEGPTICSLLRQELVGSRYEGLFVHREAAGRYWLGDDFEGSRLPTVDQDGARIHPRVRVVVNIFNGKLVIEGFYHEGEEDILNPAKVPIGPFLTVYFEGVALKEALASWKDGPPPKGGAGGVVAARAAPPAAAIGTGGSGIGGGVGGGVGGGAGAPPAAQKTDQLRALEASLPPGWEMRESRSKKGVYYFANPSKGLSQMERPKA